MRAWSSVRFATSNDHKFEEARVILSGFGIVPTRLPSKGLEIQADDVALIAKTAAAQTFHEHGGRVFVEDTGLFVRALNGFPGTYAQPTFKTIGSPGLLRLLEGEKDRRAEFVSVVAYCGRSPRATLFTGRLLGTIAPQPVGEGGWGYDSVFVPDGMRRTMGELTVEEKSSVSHRALALRAFAAWLTSKK